MEQGNFLRETRHVCPSPFVVKRILKTVPNKVVKIPNTYSRAPPYTHRLPWLTPIRVLILNYYFLYLAPFLTSSHIYTTYHNHIHSFVALSFHPHA